MYQKNGAEQVHRIDSAWCWALCTLIRPHTPNLTNTATLSACRVPQRSRSLAPWEQQLMLALFPCSQIFRDVRSPEGQMTQLCKLDLVCRLGAKMQSKWRQQEIIEEQKRLASSMLMVTWERCNVTKQCIYNGQPRISHCDFLQAFSSPLINRRSRRPCLACTFYCCLW